MKGVLKSMFFTKLKLMIGAAMVMTVLSASGLIYRAKGQAPSSEEQRSERKPMSELERLRHENELLKLNLEVVLEKVRAQDAELRTLRERINGNDAKSHNEGIRWLNEISQEQKIKEMQKTYEEFLKSRQKKSGQSSQPADRNSSNIRFTPAEGEKRSSAANQLDLARSDRLMWEERAEWSTRMSLPGRKYVSGAQAEADQARFRNALFDEATAALKVLREARDAESQRKAADTLHEALTKLRELMSQSPPNKRY
jgi:hypothetical protein